MSSVLVGRLRPRLAFRQTTQTITRSLHASGVQLVGRSKRKVNFKAHAIKNRKEHAEIYDEQDRAYDMEHMGDWEYDDHHTYGHLLMDNIRDVRKYVRLMKFEHPTLAQHAKPFRPPPSTHVLRFESTVTVGDKVQAQDRKVVLRVKVSQLGLKGPELHKFLLLVGVRYNPETDEIKMSESREATSLLNKKRLADTLNVLIAEAKKKDDMFADVPLDFSYHKYKYKMPFPAEWLPKSN
ncbi:37S ribosomal protein S24, mitochondrial [Coemansia sp. RSA 2599]|nr:37S ribosomal protein S24, mitochondrial [Coemansia sp. RSA 2598]KAJ1807184.1 37S ribosomal protein S24, mitochondrial [Coemansia sp. RSA 2599]